MVPQARYPKGADQTRLYRRLLEGLAERPELQAVGVGIPGPFRATSASGTFFIEGRVVDHARGSAVRASRHGVGRLFRGDGHSAAGGPHV